MPKTHLGKSINGPYIGPAGVPKFSSMAGGRKQAGDCVIALAPHIPGFAQNPRSSSELRAWDFTDALS
jgi:hypothetical protein